MSGLSVKQIVEQCQRGDQNAFGQLYNLTNDKLRNVCRQYISNKDDIDDVLHDAYYLIFTKINTLKDTSKAEAWMQKVVQNLALTYLQECKKQAVVSIDGLKEAAIVADPHSADNNYEEIMELIEHLPNSYRRVFRLSVLEGMSHQQIAELLNIDPHTSSAQLFRAKKLLRRSLAILLLGLLAIGVPIGLWKTKQTATIEPAKRQEGGSNQTVYLRKTDSLGLVNSQFSIGKLSVQTAQTVTQEAITADSALSLPAETTERDTTKAQEKPQEKPVRQILEEMNTIAETPEMPDFKVTTRQQDWTLALDFSGISGQQAFNLPHGEYGMNDPEIDTITHHRLPLTIGLTVNKMLGKRWAVGTGLQYTNLHSETQTGNTYSWEQREQRLHYLGIPLRATWYPVNSSRWAVYGNAQTMLELPIGSSLQQSTIVDGKLITSEQLKLNPSVQWSVGLGVGLEYRLTPVIGLYAEPSVQYFFKTGDGLDTYRTKHPATFSIPIGIRINIR